MKLITRCIFIYVIYSFVTNMSGCDFQFAKEITGIKLEDKIVQYTGYSYELLVEGEIPKGVTIQYDKNEFYEIGKWHVTAILSGSGYNQLELSATLTITEVTGLRITGIVISNQEVEYDGTVKTLEVTGITTGYTIKYENNLNIYPGIYNISVIVTKDGYVPLRLNATLIIKKGTLDNISFDDQEFQYTGDEHSIFINGQLPSDVVVSYTNNSAINRGAYNSQVVITSDYYEDLVLNATLTIL